MVFSATWIRGRASPLTRPTMPWRAIASADSAIPSEAAAWNSPATRLRSMHGSGSPERKPPRTPDSGSSTPSSVIELLPEARIPSASQSSCTTTPRVSVGTIA
jgi:hypothetical protein